MPEPLNLNELRDLPLSEVPDEYVEAVVDQGIRHRAGAQAADYLEGFLRVARPFAAVPQDGTWGEAERIVAIVVRRVAWWSPSGGARRSRPRSAICRHN